MAALIKADVREDYGEDCFVAVGFIGDGLFNLTFTMRGSTVRAISLRKATKLEHTEYAKNT